MGQGGRKQQDKGYVCLFLIMPGYQGDSSFLSNLNP